MRKITDFDRLNKLLGDVVISQGGVVPFINPEVSHHIVNELDHLLTDSCSSCPAKRKRARRRVRKSRYRVFVSLLYYYTYPLSYPIGSLVYFASGSLSLVFRMNDIASASSGAFVTGVVVGNHPVAILSHLSIVL